MSVTNPPNASKQVIIPVAAAPAAMGSKPENKIKTSTLWAIGIYSFLSMGVLYGLINYSLLDIKDENGNPKIEPGLIYSFLITGVLANVGFVITNYKKYLERDKTKETPLWKQLGYVLAFIFSVLSCIPLYWAGLSGLKFVMPQVAAALNVEPLDIRGLLGLSSILLFGVFNEAFFTARSAGLLLASIKIYKNTLDLIRQKEVKGDTLLTQDANAILELIKKETRDSDEEAYQAISYKAWYITARIASELIAWATSAAYCIIGANLVAQAIQLIYNFAANTGCDPLTTTTCGPDLSAWWLQASFIIATLMAGAFGVIYGKEGAFHLGYTLPVRAINNPTLTNWLSLASIYTLLGLCCGNALDQGLISNSALLIVILGAISPMITNMADLTRDAGDMIASGISHALMATGRGVYTAATTVYQCMYAGEDATTYQRLSADA